VDVPRRLRQQFVEDVRGGARLHGVVLHERLVGQEVEEAERGTADARPDVEHAERPGQHAVSGEFGEHVLGRRVVDSEVVDRVPERDLAVVLDGFRR